MSDFIEPVTSNHSLPAIIGTPAGWTDGTVERAPVPDTEPSPSDLAGAHQVRKQDAPHEAPDGETLDRISEEAKALIEALPAHAKFSIEVIIPVESHGLSRGFSVQVFRKHNRLHGAGDELMYYCAAPDRIAKNLKPSQRGCGRLFDMERTFLNRRQQDCTVCPHCKRAWVRDQLGDMRFYRVPIETMAEILTNLVGELGMEADIVVSRPRTRTFDLGINADMRKNTGRDNDNVINQAEKAATTQVKVCYGYQRLLQETGAGRTARDAILAFLRA